MPLLIEQIKIYKETWTYGVPQESLLGPLLFLIFIIDIHLFLNTDIADDTIFFVSGNNSDHLKQLAIPGCYCWNKVISDINKGKRTYR